MTTEASPENLGNINLTLKDTKDMAFLSSGPNTYNPSGATEENMVMQSPPNVELLSEGDGDDETTNRSLGMGSDPAHQIEFSTDKHNSFMKPDSP